MANEASASELQQLKQFTEQHPEWLQAMDALQQKTDKALNEEEMLKAEQAYALHSVKVQFDSLPPVVAREMVAGRNNKKWKRWLAGGSVVAVLCAGVAIYQKVYTIRDVSGLIHVDQIIAKRGDRKKVVLPDSSQVWVNADSRLSYNGKQFGSANREVWLEGEAFFDVTQKAAQPFIIHTGDLTIKVLGTAFNVKNYPGDATTETSLISGKVQISFKDRPDEQIILRPNEKLIVSNDQSLNKNNHAVTGTEPRITVNTLSAANVAGGQLPETAWLQNEIAFSNTSLAEIGAMLERHFDVTVAFTNQDVMNYRYTGIFKGEDLEKVLAVMKLSKPFNYNINGKKVTITN
ncbi:FecR family protein [Filimonas lacunae]|uniref:FecR family protein n=2 Tax=Filimonas lacunae TaxID=477680 RepID=A0A1N7P3E9_9BACT|nr:FecR family protein [Filimonas lacunae]